MSDHRRSPCATCAACCKSYVVPVCGYDVWLISTRQRLGPEQFLFAYPQQQPGPDGFRVDAEGPTRGLALEKRGRLRATQPCVFLMQLGGGHERCGIYAERPVVCQAYPMSMVAGAVAQRSDTLCPPDSWPEGEPALPAWRDALQRQRMHFDVYHEVVARWNARVAAAAAAAPAARFSLREYFSYLLNVYDRLAVLDGEAGAQDMARVQAEWRRLPGPLPGAAESPYAGPPPLWLEYLWRARQIIDGLYPEIAPQPLQLVFPAPAAVCEAS